MRAVLWIVMFGFLTACAGTGVYTDFDTDYSFASIKTYAWVAPKNKLQDDPFVDNDLMVTRVRRSIDAQMAGAGLTKVTAKDTADILLSYHLSSQQKITTSNHHDHFGYYPCRFCWPGAHHFSHQRDIRQYREGAFMVNLIDPKSEQLVWRGVNERRLPANVTPTDRDEFVNKVIADIFIKSPLK